MAENVLASSTSLRLLIRQVQVLAYGSRYCCVQGVLKMFSKCIFWGVLYPQLHFFYETVLVASDL